MKEIKALVISYLFFVDDCLFFTSAKTSKVKMVHKVLDIFCKASGLKINVQKSRIMVSKNIPRRKSNKFADVLGFQATKNIGKYLVF